MEQHWDTRSTKSHKNASFSVQAEHYPIVGKILLRSIREVLGSEIATDAVIDAWLAAYTQLADILIGAEAAVYKEREEASGGWRGERQFTLVRKVPESSEITSLYFSPSDKGKIIPQKPGQFISLRVTIAGEDVRRNYSLSQASNADTYRISVKREENGVVSNFLHQLEVNSEVAFLPPSGDFVYQEATEDRAQAPVIVVAGGVGITPLLPITKQVLATTSRPVVFVHITKSADVQAFRNEIGELAASYDRFAVYNWYTREGQGRRITREDLRAFLPEQLTDADAYFVGPKALMSTLKQDFESFGIAEQHLHYEFFGPLATL